MSVVSSAPPAAVESQVRHRLSVLITSRNRSARLRTALQSVLRQSITPEVLVIDDGSNDDTSSMVKSEFPEVRLVRNEKPKGVIGARNQGLSLVTAPYMVTLDDDAVLGSDSVLQVALGLAQEPSVGVVALPVVNLAGGRKWTSEWPPNRAEEDFYCLPTFMGGANLMNVEAARRLGGFRGIYRQGEEMDLSMRFLDKGLVVRAAPSDVIVYHFPETRTAFQEAEIIDYAVVNRLLSVWRATPGMVLFAGLVAVIINYARIGLAQDRGVSVLHAALRAIRQFRISERDPVTMKTFVTHRRLIRDRWMPFSMASRLMPGLVKDA